MGQVFKARDTRLDRTVAIKIVAPQLVSNPEAKARFEREARAISQLQHPHICVLHDVGNEAGLDYLVMEYLDGEVLSARLRRGPLPPAEARKIAIEIAECARLIKGYGDTHARGSANYRTIEERVILPILGGQIAPQRAADAIASARTAALVDPEGEGLAKCLAALSPEAGLPVAAE